VRVILDDAEVIVGKTILKAVGVHQCGNGGYEKKHPPGKGTGPGVRSLQQRSAGGDRGLASGDGRRGGRRF
jgi:hypothetical protein